MITFFSHQGLTKHLILLEPFKLVGEGKFNLNVLRETKVTESFLGLNMEARGCQNDEPVHNCTTRQYIENVLKACKCLPLEIAFTTDKVSVNIVTAT